MSWLETLLVVWAVGLAAEVGWFLWEAVGLVRARRRNGRERGGARNG